MARRGWCFLIVTALTAGFFLIRSGPAGSTPTSPPSLSEVRAFEIFRAGDIEGPSLPDPVEVLQDGAHPGFLLVHEYNVVLGDDGPTFEPTHDTTLTWVQHRYSKKTKTAPHAKFADLVLMCYPESLPKGLQSKHMFPDAEGIIYLYSLPSRPLYIASPIRAKNGNRLLDSLKTSQPPL